jgi:RNA binding exosome subunit
MSLVNLISKRIARQVEISVFIHSTEDRTKVLKSVRNLFPKNIEFPTYSETKLLGYFGDPITTIRFLIKHRKPATELFSNIVEKLSSLDFLSLVEELPQRIDASKNLYLRLDKQMAYKGKVRLEKHDSIRVKVSLHIPHKMDPTDIVKKYLEEKRT